MNAHEAKRTVADYLSGVRTRPEEVSEAWAALKEQGALAQFLENVIAPEEECPEECLPFMSRLDEFAGLSPAEREREFPSLCEHMARCPSCAAEFWEMAGIWVGGGAKEGPRTLRLATAIGVSAEPSGFIVWLFGPPPLERRRRGVAASAPLGKRRRLGSAAGEPTPTVGRGLHGTAEPALHGAGALPEPTEWLLADEGAGGAIRLVLTPSAERGAKLLVELTGDLAEVPNASEARLSICDAATGEFESGGPLRDTQEVPVHLKPGEWVLKVELPVPNGPTWEIPLRIGKEAHR